MAEIESENGGDPTNALGSILEANKDKLTRDAVDLWFQESTDWLTEAAERRSEIGQRKGRQGRATQGLDQIRKHAVPPQWDGDSWVFSFPHKGAVFHEYGARSHEIRAKKAEVLAFEWPDAPEEVKEQFEDTEGDLVFFESVNHPGVPAIGYVRHGLRKTKSFLEQKGYNVEVE